MKMGTWKDSLAGNLKLANLIFCYTDNLGWDVQEVLQTLGTYTVSSDNLDQLVAAITLAARPGDHILIMSNGSFGGIHKKLLKSLGESHQ